MTKTKEAILLTALRLFAKNGYEAVSVSEIASELGMVKSSLYKHYKNKRDIFEHILLRMQTADAEHAADKSVPTDTIDAAPEEYKNVSLTALACYSKEQFEYWTEDEFASLFRRMLSLERYRSEDISALYHQYLCTGPLSYLEDIFFGMDIDREEAYRLALDFYAPMYMLYDLYDAASDKPAVTEKLNDHIDRFVHRFNNEKENII